MLACWMKGWKTVCELASGLHYMHIILCGSRLGFCQDRRDQMQNHIACFHLVTYLLYHQWNSASWRIHERSISVGGDDAYLRRWLHGHAESCSNKDLTFGRYISIKSNREAETSHPRRLDRRRVMNKSCLWVSDVLWSVKRSSLGAHINTQRILTLPRKCRSSAFPRSLFYEQKTSGKYSSVSGCSDLSAR